MASFVDKLHPLVLNIGLAIHNADWNWKNVKVFSGELTWLGSQGKIKAIIQE